MHRKVKPLKKCRKMFSWFYSDPMDKPLNDSQVRLRKIVQFTIVVITIVTTLIVNSLLLTNHLSLNDIHGLFIGFFQFFGTILLISNVVGAFKSGRQLASLFQCLDQMYSSCKNLLVSFKFHV